MPSSSQMDQKPYRNTQIHDTKLSDPSHVTGLDGGISCGIQHRRFLFVGILQVEREVRDARHVFGETNPPPFPPHLARLALCLSQRKLKTPKNDNTTNLDPLNS